MNRKLYELDFQRLQCIVSSYSVIDRQLSRLPCGCCEKTAKNNVYYYIHKWLNWIIWFGKFASYFLHQEIPR